MMQLISLADDIVSKTTNTEQTNSKAQTRQRRAIKAIERIAKYIGKNEQPINP